MVFFNCLPKTGPKSNRITIYDFNWTILKPPPPLIYKSFSMFRIGVDQFIKITNFSNEVGLSLFCRESDSKRLFLRDSEKIY